MAHALRFRAMLADLGLTPPDAAKLLHVSLRTLQNWLSGRHEVPYAAYKLLRLLRYMELPGAGWAGWHFSRGQLVTPEGLTISGKDGAWWSLLVRQARGFQAQHQRTMQLQRALMLVQSDRLASDGAATPDAPSQPQAAGAAAKPPLNLSSKHFVAPQIKGAAHVG